MKTLEHPKLLLDGEWISASEEFAVRSPYSDEVIASVALAQKEHALDAIVAGETAMEPGMEPWRRAELLDRIGAGIEDRHDTLAATLSREAGKPIKLARVEVDRCVETFRYSAIEARKLVGELVPLDGSPTGTGQFGFTVRVPKGVVAAITPFNFPLNLVAHKIAPALAAGCAVVLKPSLRTPLSALALAEIYEQAGVPPGWLNVVPGHGAELAEVFTGDERVSVITFTGSAEVGWLLRARAPKKTVLLELGNSTPAIVEPDADLELAATKLAKFAFSFAGQSCISVQRVYIHSRVHDAFAAHFVDAARHLEFGDPAADVTDVGPVIDDHARDRILEWVIDAEVQGAEILCGGRAHGRVIEPTVVSNVRPAAKLVCREVFGPVCSLVAYESWQEAIELANATPYGLQAGIFTADVTKAIDASRSLRFGGVTINEAPGFRVDLMPYGGVKDSGNTKEGPAYTVRAMTEDRLVMLALDGS